MLECIKTSVAHYRLAEIGGDVSFSNRYDAGVVVGGSTSEAISSVRAFESIVVVGRVNSAEVRSTWLEVCVPRPATDGCERRIVS